MNNTNMRKILQPDGLAGSAIVCVGVVTLIYGGQYGLGNLTHPGPGFFPALCGVALTLVGSALVVIGVSRPKSLPRPDVMPIVSVLGAILVFASTIESLGLALATFLTIGLVGLFDSRFKIVTVLALALLLSGATVLVFAVGLGLSLPIGPAASLWKH